ncbi:MAG: hypothetical protein ACFB0E_04370 [Leptolyngbyaceae cyanobacterium]
MVDLTPPVSVLSPNTAANELRAHGLDALGLTVPTLSSVWSRSPVAASAYDSAALTLTLAAADVRAPFRGILTEASTPALWSDVSGRALTGPAAVLRLHPEAARRLERIATARYGDPLILPVPVAMVVRTIAPPDPTSALNWYLAGESLGLAGDNVSLSFHDARGLIIDPIAVAAMFADLLTWRPALNMTEDAAATGDVADIAELATGVLCHVIDPHGWAYRTTHDAAVLKIINESGEQQSALEESLFNWAVGDLLGRANDDDPTPEVPDDAPPPPLPPLQWGWATNGILSRQSLSLPTLPEGVNLSRQFLRVMAVDLDWHLLGNRSDSEIASGDTTIPGDDDRIPDYVLPQVRQAVPNFEYLVDGMAVLSAANEMAMGFPPADTDVLALTVSPEIDPSLAVPPGVDVGMAPLNNVDPTQNLSAQWQVGSSLDVILTLPAGAVPEGTHVRVFPRQFVMIRTIGQQASFKRGDGGAAIAQAGDTAIRLVNPLALDDDTVPNPAYLTIDIVLVNSTGQRRLFSAISVTVEGSTEWTDNLSDFGGQAILSEGSGIGGLQSAFSSRAIAPTPLFGVPNSSPPAEPNPNLSGIGQLVRRLASEEQPRQGPHLPTQARFETILALGAATGDDEQLRWNALLTGARWAWESRSARPELGNPGNPAGPDIHATGIRCDGQLAYDLAFHALKRSQSIIPLAADSLGWLITSAGDNWDAPDPDSSGTVSAAMLETIAPFCDSPALSALEIRSLDVSIQDRINALITTITTALSPPITIDPADINVKNEEEIRPRLQREIATAKYGQRDALWSLRRALGQARELIYIESPTFARTAHPGGEALPHEIDLVNVIAERLNADPRLKVILCLPRHPDFAPERDNWELAAINHRTEALNTLLATVPPDRVAAFHPVGFPGRSTAIRSTTIIVDDIWCIVGTSHLRRRGMTFDGGVDVVSFDREVVNGYSSQIARFRQLLMATKLGVTEPTQPSNTSALWVRLAWPESAFDVVADLLRQGGLGRCNPIWAGPTEMADDFIATELNLADPDGVDVDNASFLNLLINQLIESS